MRGDCRKPVRARPRGIGPTTNRLFEVMRMGRSPVIIADDWARPPGPDWDSFAVFVKESDLDLIPDILEPLSSRAEEMGQKAHLAWEAWFSPDVALSQQLAEIESLAKQRANFRTSNLIELWNSRDFWKEHGWTLGQRLNRRFRRLARKWQLAAKGAGPIFHAGNPRKPS